MAVVLTRETEPSTFEELFDGFEARYCYIDGKYYISVRDLIIGMCVESPKKDAESWNAACKYASNTWQKITKNSKIEELNDSFRCFQFEGNLLIQTLKIGFIFLRNLFLCRF